MKRPQLRKEAQISFLAKHFSRASRGSCPFSWLI